MREALVGALDASVLSEARKPVAAPGDAVAQASEPVGTQRWG